MNNKRFYFTYGTEGQPFYGGWTIVEASDRKAACTAFRLYHPDKIEGILNCASVYTEEEMQKTVMWGECGNFGYREHEIIRLERTNKMEKNLMTYDELVTVYRQWLLKNFYENEKDYFEREINRHPDEYKPSFEDGWNVASEEPGTVCVRYSEALRKRESLEELSFSFDEYSRPILDDDGSIEDYEVIGYELGLCD